MKAASRLATITHGLNPYDRLIFAENIGVISTRPRTRIGSRIDTLDDLTGKVSIRLSSRGG
jgi:hypothetical protein